MHPRHTATAAPQLSRPTPGPHEGKGLQANIRVVRFQVAMAGFAASGATKYYHAPHTKNLHEVNIKGALV